ncbi:hypothetical protein DFH27DRAFT_604573 [Peziza echinospora]|nr:hypothetical protein DFH27DRAFT_604573 [Peziza echinospora]
MCYVRRPSGGGLCPHSVHAFHEACGDSDPPWPYPQMPSSRQHIAQQRNVSLPPWTRAIVVLQVGVLLVWKHGVYRIEVHYPLVPLLVVECFLHTGLTWWPGGSRLAGTV